MSDGPSGGKGDDCYFESDEEGQEATAGEEGTESSGEESESAEAVAPQTAPAPEVARRFASQAGIGEQILSGAKGRHTKIVHFDLCASMAELKAMGVAEINKAAKLKGDKPAGIRLHATGNLAKILCQNGNQFALRTGKIVGFSNSFPISFAVNADHMSIGMQSKNEITMAGECIMKIHKTTPTFTQVAAKPFIICARNDALQKIKSTFPKMTKDNCLDGLRFFSGDVAVAVNSPLHYAVNSTIAFEQQKAKDENVIYTPEKREEIEYKGEKFVEVTKERLEHAKKFITGLFGASLDSMNVEDLYLTISPCVVSQAAQQKQASAMEAASIWDNLPEIGKVDDYSSVKGSVSVAVQFTFDD